MPYRAPHNFLRGIHGDKLSSCTTKEQEEDLPSHLCSDGFWLEEPSLGIHKIFIGVKILLHSLLGEMASRADEQLLDGLGDF